MPEHGKQALHSKITELIECFPPEQIEWAILLSIDKGWKGIYWERLYSAPPKNAPYRENPLFADLYMPNHDQDKPDRKMIKLYNS